MLAGEPDFSSWPRSNILVSDSSDGGSAARAAPRQTLNKPQTAAGPGELMQELLPLATAQSDCPLAEADAHMPGVVCARQKNC
jgi:hypothetical protein